MRRFGCIAVAWLSLGTMAIAQPSETSMSAAAEAAALMHYAGDWVMETPASGGMPAMHADAWYRWLNGGDTSVDLDVFNAPERVLKREVPLIDG